MNRAFIVVFGLVLFGAGLLLGMAGSFFRSMPVEPPPRKISTVPTPVPSVLSGSTNAAVRVARPRPKPVAAAVTNTTPQSVENALTDAMNLLATALTASPQLSTSTPRSVSAQVAAPAPEPGTPSAATSALPAELPPELASQIATQVAAQLAAMQEQTGMSETVPPPDVPAATAAPAPVAPPVDPSAGHWVYDNRMGWLWLPEAAVVAGSPVVLPLIEVYPGGYITIHADRHRQATRPSQPAQSQPATRNPAWYPTQQNPSSPAWTSPKGSSVVQQPNNLNTPGQPKLQK